jgi:hypothetical protein
MSNRPDTDFHNKVTVMLVQSLWGAISPNFRMIAISFSSPVWKLLFLLESDDEKDREEIEDVIGEFDALLLGLDVVVPKYEIEVMVNNSPLPRLDHSVWQVVFGRREI